MRPQKSYKVNHQIQARNVRVLLEGSQEILPLSAALNKAKEKNLDLIQINGQVDPPICKIQSLGKFLYQEEKTRKIQKNPKSKEIQLHPNIAPHDLETKVKQTQGFLKTQHPVTLKMKFRGRENTHKELGVQVLNQILEATSHLCHKNGEPQKNGNLILLHLHPCRTQ
jgi:translation initiation factor IF-3